MSTRMAGEATVASGRGRRVESGSARFRVRRWSRAGEPVLSVEAEPGTPLPAYAERRSIRETLRPTGTGRVILFTDAARVSGVWSWVEREDTGPLAYRERVWNPAHPQEIPERGEVGRRALLARGSPRARRATRSALVALLARERVEAAGPHPECADPGQLLQDLVEKAASADELRRLWRGVSRLRVLDPQCGSGEWLIGAGEALAAVYLACMERMDAWLADEARSGIPARRTKLGDLRAILTAADDTHRWTGRRRYARELALCRNLRGADPDPLGAADAAERLEAWVRGGEDGGPGAPLLPLLVRAGRVSMGAVAARRGAGGVGGGGGEVAEGIARAAAQLRRGWLEQRAEEGAVGAAARALRARLDSLSPESNSAETVEPWTEYFEILRAGGFHLVHRSRR